MYKFRKSSSSSCVNEERESDIEASGGQFPVDQWPAIGDDQDYGLVNAFTLRHADGMTYVCYEPTKNNKMDHNYAKLEPVVTGNREQLQLGSVTGDDNDTNPERISVITDEPKLNTIAEKQVIALGSLFDEGIEEPESILPTLAEENDVMTSEKFNVHPVCSGEKCAWSRTTCSVPMSGYNQEACSNVAKRKNVSLNLNSIALIQKLKPNEHIRLLDRYALLTDGNTCWNPPLFLKNKHPIPNLEPPTQKFRQSHSNLLKYLVKESVSRGMRSDVCNVFERECLKREIPTTDLDFFRVWDYDISVIKTTWFGPDRAAKVPKSERLKWFEKRPVLKQLVSSLEEAFNAITPDAVDERVRSPQANIDWLFVSTQMLTRGFRNISPEGCKRLWQNALSPKFTLPVHWSQQEFSRLKALTTRPGKRNFIKIAKEMGPKFSPFLCLKMFVKYIRPVIDEGDKSTNDEELHNLWKQDKVQTEYLTCMDMFNGSFRSTALWLSHAYDINITEKFLLQQNEKYKIGPFSLYEDALLLVVDEIIQALCVKLYSFSDFLPWRPEVAWAHRIDSIRFPHRTDSGGKNEWSEAEDRLILKLVKKYRKHWHNFPKHFVNPKRSRKAIQSRYVLLCQSLRTSTLEEFHASRRNVIRTRFYYMRKTLMFLEEFDETRSKTESATDLNVPVVHKLFKSCNERFRQNQVCLKPSKSCDMFPQPTHLQYLLLHIPRFYFVQAVEKIRTFFNATGIPATLPP